MSLDLVFRTDDGAKWGTGQGSDLTPAQADNNNWKVKQAVEDLQDNPPDAVSIDSITQSVPGGPITIHLTDATTQGPFSLPTIPLTFRGAWVISTAYAVGDVITSGGSTYLVIFAHTSDGVSFDPGENDGLGHNYYGLLLENPAGALPAGGSAGQILTKTSSTDYAAAWAAIGAVLPIRNVTGTTHQIAAVDSGKRHRFTNVSNITVTVPDNDTEEIPIGSVYVLRQCSTGALSIVEGSSGVLINGLYGFEYGTDLQGAAVELLKVDTDTWDLTGFQATP